MLHVRSGVRGEVVQDDMAFLPGMRLDGLLHERQEARAVPVRLALAQHFTGRDVQCGEQVHGAVPHRVMGALLRGRKASGSTGWVRSRACTCVFSSTDSTTALPGGDRYKPTTSATFSTNAGSFESLKVPERCGFRFSSRQMRPM